ncbi:hypothetical protein NUW54_g7204 [Trametes sanguinea]|uniref:Uncharacterized protein n=1 Tax=Trametes sanguinea TaxID=158606 RepID=A0ACC1PMK4_9APHY|nr:hypothetical protein NUW54_g7204 [Trametes sanguinea]
MTWQDNADKYITFPDIHVTPMPGDLSLADIDMTPFFCPLPKMTRGLGIVGSMNGVASAKPWLPLTPSDAVRVTAPRRANAPRSQLLGATCVGQLDRRSSLLPRPQRSSIVSFSALQHPEAVVLSYYPIARSGPTLSAIVTAKVDLQHSRSMKGFCPPSYRYAVIQMDPVGMVKQFNDPLASDAAAAMNPKKYLVYLQRPVGLAPPTDPWFRYRVSLIGTTLRPEDKEKGITSDMVIPILPNTFHPSGHRAPIRTHPTFPFDNCFHWVRNDMTVRIRRKAVRYDDANAVKVDAVQHLEIDKGFWEDYDRMEAYASFRADEDSGHGDEAPHSEDEGDIQSVEADDFDTLPEALSDARSTDSGYPPSGSSSAVSRDSVAALMRMDILGLNMDDTVEFLPLVDMWYELTEHLTKETIPSPFEFYKECDTIMRIIHDARERAPSDFTPSPFVDNGIEIDYDALSSHHSIRTADHWREELSTVDPELLRRYGITLEPKQELAARRGDMPWQFRMAIITTKGCKAFACDGAMAQSPSVPAILELKLDCHRVHRKHRSHQDGHGLGEERPSSKLPSAHILASNIFGSDVDDTADSELMSLVDLWHELADHLTAETIPSPVELYKEQEEVIRIIRDAREMTPSIRVSFLDNGVEIDDSDDVLGGWKA